MESLNQHLWLGFAGGIFAFAHCLGMCGGFVLHLSLGKSGRGMIGGQLLWQAGKLCTYMFLGALAGYAGGFLGMRFSSRVLFQNLLSYATGGVILFMGLSLLGMLPVRAKNAASADAGALAALSKRFFSASSPGAALTMGMATGFLPCPIVLAFLSYSLQSGSVLNGMATMGALSLGTMLPLLLLGGASRLTGIHLRSWGPKAGGIILVLLGLATALRGTAVYHRLLGCPPKPALQQSRLDIAKPCCTSKVNAPH